MGVSPFSLSQPSIGNLSERFHAQIVEFVSSLPLSNHKARRLEHLEVLRDPLSRQTELVLHR